MCIDVRMDIRWARAIHRRQALAEAVILSTGTPTPVQQTCRRRWPIWGCVQLNMVALPFMFLPVIGGMWLMTKRAIPGEARGRTYDPVPDDT